MADINKNCEQMKFGVTSTQMKIADRTAGSRLGTGQVAFWLPFIFGTLLLLFGSLFTATPSPNHVADAAIFGVATFLICMSLLVGIARTNLRLAPSARITGIALAAELAVCIWLLVDALTHLHRL